MHRGSPGCRTAPRRRTRRFVRACPLPPRCIIAQPRPVRLVAGRRYTWRLMRSRLPPGGLYAITDGPRDDLLAVCAAALNGGATLLQYRDKSADRARRAGEVHALLPLCAAHGVPLIVNDDV